MRARLAGFLFLSCVMVASDLPAAELPKVAVMPLKANRVEAQTVTILDELLVNEVAQRGSYFVIGASDISAMLGLERMKDALGCDDLSCAAELGGALGVDLILAGSVSILGDELIVSLSLIDTAAQKAPQRGQARVHNQENNYTGAIVEAVSQLFGGRVPSGPQSSAAPMGPTDPTVPGSRQRVTGLLVAGAGLAGVVTGVILSHMNICSTHYSDVDDRDWCDTTSGSVFLASGMAAGGLLLAGVGTGWYLDGRAMTIANSDTARARMLWRYVGWGGAVLTAIVPPLFIFTAEREPENDYIAEDRVGTYQMTSLISAGVTLAIFAASLAVDPEVVTSEVAHTASAWFLAPWTSRRRGAGAQGLALVGRF